ncbi:MAG: hypothetical protein ACE366_30840 [Bradymonadia bacterium]
MSLSVAAMCGLHGCPDSAGVYDDFEGKAEQYEPVVLADADIPDMALAGCTVDPSVCEIDGDYLLTLATQIDPGRPVQFRVTATYDGDSRMLDWTLIPLRQKCDDGADCAADDPRRLEDLPDGAINPDPVLVGEDGSFSIDFGQATVPGDGNAISGSPIVATLILNGRINDDRSMCGNFEGALIEPFPFDLVNEMNNFGTTFLDEGVRAGEVIANDRCP